MPNLVVFERNAIVRRHILAMVAAMPEIESVEETDSAGRLLTICQQASWDVAVVGLLGRGEETVQLVANLRKLCPTIPIIAISFVLYLVRIKHLRRAGIKGLLASEDLADELTAAIRAVLAGEEYLSQAVQITLNAEAAALRNVGKPKKAEK